MTRRVRAVVLAAAVYLLGGCASVAPPSAPLSPDLLAGRIAVIVEAHAGQPARSQNAAFELRGSAARGALDLATPLGSLLAQARWDAAGALLTTPQGAQRYGDLDAMAEAMLGERVPVAALFDWLRGRPWPGAPSTGAAKGFEQLGWSVDTSRSAEALVTATRRAPPPAVTVRARLDPA